MAAEMRATGVCVRSSVARATMEKGLEHSDRIKIPTVVVVHLASFALSAAGIVATLRIAFGGQP
jgi:hypothetical protein